MEEEDARDRGGGRLLMRLRTNLITITMAVSK